MEDLRDDQPQSQSPEPEPEPEPVIPDWVRESVTRDYTPQIILDEEARRHRRLRERSR